MRQSPSSGPCSAIHQLTDDPKLLEKLAAAEFSIRGADSKVTPLKASMGKDALEATVPSDPSLVLGVCNYGVVQRGDSPPFLLHYYAKTAVSSGGDDGFKPTERLLLEIVPVRGTEPVLEAKVLWKGKPLAGAEVVLVSPDSEKPKELKTDADGTFRLFRLDQKLGEGLYGLRARHVEAKEGEADGKKYNEARYYSTLTFRVSGFKVVEKVVPEVKPVAALKEDPAATKLLADARAARAEWENFPGFKADLEVNIDGNISKGTVTISDKGDVSLKLDGSEDAVKWAKRHLASLVGHRMSEGAGGVATPCAFPDENVHHPLGRTVQVLNDEFHSSYRIRDRQVIVVNRMGREVRFTITVMENRLTAEKKFLPVSYVVNTWDAKTDALRSSDTFHHTWKRVGKFDLPETVDVVTATAGKLEARSMRLTHLELAK